jgi:hypothetical protein
MLQGTLTFLVSCEIGRGICVLDRWPADALSSRREENKITHGASMIAQQHVSVTLVPRMTKFVLWHDGRE